MIPFMLAGILCFSCAACGKTNEQDNANTTVPADTDVTLDIQKADGNKTVFAMGTELDPHFFSQNVGLSGTTNGKAWECKAEDWELFEQRMKDMNLKRIRVMLLPSWYVTSEASILNNAYNYDNIYMDSLYRTLTTAKNLGMTVNITMWGVDCQFMRSDESGWVTTPKDSQKKNFVDCFADCIKYLIEEKGYDCIKEVTLYNEPNSSYTGTFGNDDYCDLCKMMHDSFVEKGVRDKVLFNLSDDARDYKWLANTLRNLEGIVDVVNSHTYNYGDTYDQETGTMEHNSMTNEQICHTDPSYPLDRWKDFREGYEHIPHMWGEFGTRNGSGSHTSFDKMLPERGLDIARICLNFFNTGSVGASYWVLFSQYYGRDDFAIHKIMDMGLWGFADEGYACRPVYYSYSMLTRFVEAGDTIYPLESADGNIVGVAFRRADGKWSYCVVNNGETDKKVAFVNYDSYPESLNRYVYEEAAVPTDNKVIGSNGTMTADGRVLSDVVPARSFAVYTDK